MSHHRIVEIQKVVTFCCNMSDNILRASDFGGRALRRDMLYIEPNPCITDLKRFIWIFP